MLSVARSLVGERDLLHSYRVVQENLMPNFSRSGSRPVLIAEEPNGTGASRARSFQNSEPAVPAAEANSMRLEKGQVMSGQQKEMFGTSVQAAPEMRASKSRGRWMGNPFSPRPTLRADSKGQLSLEFVKVVRNDLSEADLELVPAKSRVVAPSMSVSVSVAPSPTPPTVPAPPRDRDSLEPEPSRWSRFTARLFRSGTPG